MAVQVTAICLVLLCLVSTLSSVDGVVTCNPKPLPVVLTAEISSPEVVVNFDDITSFDGTAGKNVSASGSTVDVTLIGPTCGIYQGFGLTDYKWIDTKNWYPENDASPIRFPAVLADSNGYCDLIFSEPIGYFSIRVAGTSASPAGIFIYDDANQELNCNMIPWMGQGGHDNSYAVRGFSSNAKNIKKIRIKDSYSVADLLRYSRCPPGTTLVGSICVLPCDMDPAPCNVDTQDCANVEGTAQCTCKAGRVLAGSSCVLPCDVILAPCDVDTQDCANLEGNSTAQCTCKQYYTTDNIGHCIPMTCTYSSQNCNEHARCDDTIDKPFYKCTCREGYTGNAYGTGVNGCTAIPVPIAPPVDPPVSDTPQAVSGPTSEPSVSASPTSEPMSSEPTTTAPVSAPTTKGVVPTTRVSAGSVIVELTVLTFIIVALAINC